MKSHDEGDAPIIIFRAHPPERLLRSLARGHIAGACCCCCCCCLHSLGSLAGAAIGSFYARNPPDSGTAKPFDKLRDVELDGPAREQPARFSVNALYWLVTFGGLVLVSMLAAIRYGSADIWSILFVPALFLPAIQLGGSLLCMFIIGGTPELRRDIRAWKGLGWITAATIVGCLSGILIMYIYANAHR
jgi:hypothetical protein